MYNRLKKTISLFILFQFVILVMLPCIAKAAIDPAAAVVKLRTSCTDNGVTLDDCFTSFGAVTTWMANTRKPNVSNPLKVEIGPGKFTGQASISCNATNNYTGYTSFEGSGQGRTNINSKLAVASCTELNFLHLTIDVVTGFPNPYGGITWDGGGNSHWNDVAVNGAGSGWYSNSCGATPGSHYWTASRLTTIAAFSAAETYQESCDESWFFGSEITASVPANAYPASGGAVVAIGRGIIHVYGSVLRALINGPTQTGYGVTAAAVAVVGGPTGGEIHIHGTGIDVIATNSQNIVAIYGGPNGMIHANTTSYNLMTGSGGTVTRVMNGGGHVHAPYLWEHIPDPVTTPNFTSVTGADMTTVTTGTSDGHPHFLIYDSSCSSRWYDTVDKICRP